MISNKKNSTQHQIAVVVLIADRMWMWNHCDAEQNDWPNVILCNGGGHVHALKRLRTNKTRPSKMGI